VLLLERLVDGEADDRLDRIATHCALAGAELTFFQARLAHQRGDLDRTRRLVHDSLLSLPGHSEFLAFAAEVDAPLPARAQQVAAQQAAAQVALEHAAAQAAPQARA
jgi:hypothetical protein